AGAGDLPEESIETGLGAHLGRAAQGKLDRASVGSRVRLEVTGDHGGNGCRVHRWVSTPSTVWAASSTSSPLVVHLSSIAASAPSLARPGPEPSVSRIVARMRRSKYARDVDVWSSSWRIRRISAMSRGDAALRVRTRTR